MKKGYNRICFWGIFLLLDILLSWVFFYICDMWLIDIFGPDIMEYENWFGDFDTPIVYRFGIGSVEILITLLQAVIFVFMEVMLHKKEKISKRCTGIAGVIHVLNFLIWVLFYVEWNGWVNIPEFILPQYIVQKILYM